MLILVAGAMGRFWRHFIAELLDDPLFSKAHIQAFCHNHSCDETDHAGVVRGPVAERHIVAAELDFVTDFVHRANCKETPDDVIDMTVEGLFRILEEFPASPTARQFIPVGGEAGSGHSGSAWQYGRPRSDRRVVRYAG